jgi:hypothetical protein
VHGRDLDVCGYLARVTAATARDITATARILGAAWEPQRKRMETGIYFPLFLIAATPEKTAYSIFYLPADLQRPEMFN